MSIIIDEVIKIFLAECGSFNSFEYFLPYLSLKTIYNTISYFAGNECENFCMCEKH